ncbi:MAG: P-II family nitrogen regulator, partial [Candidatus Altiarchaeota archaeon]|nr:P-II family nitrogen regulator [Candidatus Altiarchaeota archaeon]
GCGSQKGFHEVFRTKTEEVNLLPKVRLEIAVNEDFVEPTIEAISRGARTGEIGDGKIFVLSLAECVRIRTGERGGAAIG